VKTEPEAETRTIMPLEGCGRVMNCQANPAGYAHAARPSYSYAQPSKKRIAQYALQQLGEAWKRDCEAHERNLAAIENNKLVRARIEAMMAEIGMPRKHSYVPQNSRARYPKRVTEDAGWLKDMQREVKISDGFESSQRNYATLKERYDAYAAEAEKEAELAATAAARAEEQRKAERRANIELATIVIRYELDPDVEWSDVLDALRKRNQRLDLALAMMDTRGDWSEGPYRVASAINRFKINDDIDKQIVADVAPHIADWDGDGRIFRDIRWNYGAILETIEDRQLVDDALKAHEKGSDL